MIIATIPARSGSRGVPHKNIAYLKGKPLLAWSIEVAKQVPEIDRVFVSSDSQEYLTISRTYGATPVLRPQELSQDLSTDYEWVVHLLKIRSLIKKQSWELIVHFRPTTPLRDPKLISEAIAKLGATPEATSLRSVHEMGESAYKCGKIIDRWLVPVVQAFFCSDMHGPRQVYPKTYQPNGYVDIYRVKHILEDGELYGDKILAFETPRVTEVDTPEDLEYLRWRVKK